MYRYGCGCWDVDGRVGLGVGVWCCALGLLAASSLHYVPVMPGHEQRTLATRRGINGSAGGGLHRHQPPDVRYRSLDGGGEGGGICCCCSPDGEGEGEGGHLLQLLLHVQLADDRVPSLQASPPGGGDLMIIFLWCMWTQLHRVGGLAVAAAAPQVFTASSVLCIVDICSVMMVLQHLCFFMAYIFFFFF